MPQSLVKVWIHAIFSTKNREPMITPSYEYEIYRKMREKLYALNSEVPALNGTENRVHILFKLPVAKSLAHTMQIVKGGASHWFNEQYLPKHALYWQDGYAAFSVSESLLPNVKSYIDNQKEIHQQRTLDEKLRLIQNRLNT